MFVSHFALAAIVKSFARSTPLWALMLGSVILDLIFLLLAALGVEKLAADGNAYGQFIQQAAYSHSLVVAIVLAVLAGLLVMRPWGTQAGLAIGGIVFGDWLLGWVFFENAWPVVPGDNSTMNISSLGLASRPEVGLIVAAVLALAGAYLYLRVAMRLPAPQIRSSTDYRTLPVRSAAVNAVLLVAAFVASLLGLL
jgi:hypothetical protein